MWVDYFVPILCLLQYSLTHTPEGIQSLSILKQCLLVLYMMSILPKFNVLIFRTLSGNPENGGLLPPLWNRGELVCVWKG